ncbi:MAG: sodium:solute symporter family protein [Elusimicrobiota bacterium]|nr:sodium:solute symporter family protein [Elusimicrobiota bacterium]
MLGNLHVGFFIGGFIVYIGIMILIGYLASKGKSDGKDYLTGGAKLPFYLIFATLAATFIGTGSAIGATANGFRAGWYGSAYGLGAAAGLFLLAYCVTKVKPRQKGFITMCEEAQFCFDGSKEMRIVMSFMMFFVEIIWLGNHMNGGATFLGYITGIDLLTAKILVVLGFGIYVVIGGYLAVVWTDLIQLSLILVGFIVIAVVAIPIAGGWDAISATYIAAGKEGALSVYGIKDIGFFGLFALLFGIFIPALGTPTYRMRVYTAKDEKTGLNAITRTAILLLLFSLLPALIGMAAFTIATQNGAAAILARPDFAFAYLATVVLGPVLGLFFMIAGLSATLSSGDSDAIAGVTILIQDIYPVFAKKALPENKVKKWSRGAIVVTLLCAFVLTLFAKDIMSYILNVLGSFVPGVSVAMFLGVAWKRVTWQGGLAAIFSGTLFGVFYLLVPPFQAYFKAIFTAPAIPATIVSLAFAIIISLATKKPVMTESEKIAAVEAARVSY